MNSTLVKTKTKKIGILFVQIILFDGNNYAFYVILELWNYGQIDWGKKTCWVFYAEINTKQSKASSGKGFSNVMINWKIYGF